MKRFLLVLTLIFILSSSCTVFAFSDTDNHWAKSSIDYLVERGILHGMGDGTFAPDSTVSVSEFITMVVQLSSPTIQPARENEHWAVPYFQKALNDNLILPGEFDGLDRGITRAEMAKIIIRAINLEQPKNPQEIIAKITDFTSISAKDQDYVLRTYAAGIIVGYPDESFKPNNTITRAEAAVIIYKTIQYKQ